MGSNSKILHGDTSGVCYNCLNGFHSGCDGKCSCALNNHKETWWKTESEVIKAEIIKAWEWMRANNNTIPDNILDLMKNAAIEKINSQ